MAKAMSDVSAGCPSQPLSTSELTIQWSLVEGTRKDLERVAQFIRRLTRDDGSEDTTGSEPL